MVSMVGNFNPHWVHFSEFTDYNLHIHFFSSSLIFLAGLAEESYPNLLTVNWRAEMDWLWGGGGGF
jgi:hypothetical protein